MPLSPGLKVTPRRVQSAGAAAVVAFVTLLVFWPVGRYPFVSYDDGIYIFENDPVKAGLTASGLRWAFTTLYETNWHPLTWMSHMLDVELFGVNAGAHHLSSLAVHLTTSLLLLAVLCRFTGRLWRSAMVAVLFAVHPLHVESVAWVAERKDVLSALFWMLTMAAYLWYVRKPGALRYVFVVGVYILGLMAKSMVVTLPLVLLLLDFWPLGRLEKNVLWRLLREKIPLLLLALTASSVALVAQSSYLKEANTLELYPLPLRLANAVVTYATYLMDMVRPFGLAYFYPYPVDGYSVGVVAAAVIFLTGFTLLVVRQGRRSPFLIAGWGWYLVTLLPVIGIVKIGLQARADRYTYLPLVGMFVLAVWSGAALAPRWSRRAAALVAAGGMITVLCVVLARQQVGYWRDTETLNRHAIAVTSENWVALVNLGSYLSKQGKVEESLQLYQEAATHVPARAERHFRSGVLLAGLGKDREAVAEYRQAAELYPPFALANFDLGVLRARQGYWEDAAADFAAALKYRPDYPEARYNLQTVLEGLGYEPGSLEDFLRNESRPLGRRGGSVR